MSHKGPSGASVTYCNISCFLYFGCTFFFDIFAFHVNILVVSTILNTKIYCCEKYLFQMKSILQVISCYCVTIQLKLTLYVSGLIVYRYH